MLRWTSPSQGGACGLVAVANLPPRFLEIIFLSESRLSCSNAAPVIAAWTRAAVPLNFFCWNAAAPKPDWPSNWVLRICCWASIFWTLTPEGSWPVTCRLTGLRIWLLRVIGLTLVVPSWMLYSFLCRPCLLFGASVGSGSSSPLGLFHMKLARLFPCMN